MRRLPARFGALAASGAIALAALALAAAPASAAAKPDYSVSIAPASVAGGSTGLTLTATITDENAILPVQVVGLSWPGAVTVTAASLPAGYPAPVLTTCGSGASSTPCVQLRKLGLKPHASVALKLTVNTPAACSNVIGAWHVSARSDLLFTLLNLLLGGNGSLNLDPASTLSTTVTDSCHFKFTQGPTDAVLNQAISGTAFTPSGPALTVGIYDQNAIAVPLNGVSVAMGLNATAGTLGGTTPQSTSAGVATFGNLTASAAADADTLTASTSNVPAIASATSGPFNVVSAEVTCSTSPCNLNANSGTNTLAIDAMGGTSGALQGSILSGGLACTNYPAGDFVLDPNVYQVQSAATGQSKEVTISFQPPPGSDAPVVDTSDLDFGEAPDEPAGSADFDDVLYYSDVCFEATQSFPTRAGTGDGSGSAVSEGNGLFAGILPDCPGTLSTATEPCHDRASDQVTGYAGNDGTLNYTINLSVYIPASFTGDPRMN